jgi:hypothetical protein
METDKAMQRRPIKENQITIREKQWNESDGIEGYEQKNLSYSAYDKSLSTGTAEVLQWRAVDFEDWAKHVKIRALKTSFCRQDLRFS